MRSVNTSAGTRRWWAPTGTVDRITRSIVACLVGSEMCIRDRILRRPDYERPYLLLPVGYPADGCQVPDIQRRPLGDVLVFDR